MGVDVWTAKFLASESARGVEFARTLTLGRQSLYMTQAEYEAVYPGAPPDPTARFADDFLFRLGARTLDAIDVSGYEGANIIHDLNWPLVEPEKRWTCVFDGGALEHIFHFPTAIKNCMEATAIGGHFLTACPWTGFAGHGFYQFSPELLYRVLSPENGFEIERMLFRCNGRWLAIIDPRITGRRFEYQSKEATLLFASARRIRQTNVLAHPPQQSDYATMWAAPSHLSEPAVSGAVRHFAEALLPGLTRRLRAWREERRTLKQGTVAVRL
jgi:hypothetical protein